MSTTRVRGLAGCVVACVLAACGSVATQRIGGVEVPRERPHAPRELRLDVEHYALSLELDPAQRELRGTCTVRAWPRVGELREIELDLEGLTVEGVQDAAGRALAFRHAAGVLAVDLGRAIGRGEMLEISVKYGGKPAKGLWFGGERDGLATQAFTQGECEDSRWWFPCVDDPSERATSELQVVLPRGWTSFAAGELLQRGALDDGRAFEHWRMATPHPAYLLTLAAGEFASRQERWRNVPLTYAARPELAGELEPTFAETAQMLEFFSDLTGVRYPFAKYSQVCVDNFLMGGMENISATTLTDTVLTDERGRRDNDGSGLIAHELAHQWFGDLLTCNDWSHVWLNEGFATYMPLLYYEATRGTDEFREGVREMQRSYLAADVGSTRRPTVWNVYRDPIDLFFGGQAYPGGGSRLHHLRFVLGDQAFFRGIRAYVREHSGRGVVTGDLERAMEAASGVELDAFFAQWFHASGYPEFEVRWTWSESSQTVRVRVEQVHLAVGATPSVFRGPAQIELAADGASQRVRVDVEQRLQTFELPCAARPTWVVFDEHGWWPARIAHARSRDEWRALLADDDDPNSRADAAAALGVELAGAFGEDERWRVAQGLLNALTEDDAPSVRAAAARAFGSVRGPAEHAIASALEHAAASDEAPAVRIAAFASLTKWGIDPSFAAFGREQFDAGYSYATMAAAAALVVVNDPENAREWLVSKLDLPSPHDALRAALLNLLASLSGDEVTDELRRRALDERAASASREIAVRNLGLRAKHLAEVRAELVGLLATTRSYRLQTALIEALGNIGDAPARAALTNFYARSVDPRHRRAIERVLGRAAS